MDLKNHEFGKKLMYFSIRKIEKKNEHQKRERKKKK